MKPVMIHHQLKSLLKVSYAHVHVYSLMCTLHVYKQGLGSVLYVQVHNVHAYQQEDIMIMYPKSLR